MDQRDIFELPVGTYDVLVFDSQAGWGRCNFWATAEGEEDPLKIEFGAFSILSVSNGPSGMGNLFGGPELAPPFVAAYQTKPIKITTGQIATLMIERDYTELGAIEPDWEQPELFRFTWGTRLWTLDKLQAQCVQQLLKSHGTSEFLNEFELLELLDADVESVVEIFNQGQHPAFGKLVIMKESDDGEREYRLSDLVKPAGLNSMGQF